MCLSFDSYNIPHRLSVTLWLLCKPCLALIFAGSLCRWLVKSGGGLRPQTTLDDSPLLSMLKVANHMHHPTQPKKDFRDFQRKRIGPKHQVLLRSLGGIFLSAYSQFAGLAVETPSLSGSDGSDGSKGSDGSEGKLFFRGWPDRISTITERWFSNWFSRSWQMVDRSLKWFHSSALSHPSRCSLDINSCISWEELAIIAS